MQYIITGLKNAGKGRVELCLNEKIIFWLYMQEVRQISLLFPQGTRGLEGIGGCPEGVSLKEGMALSEEVYQHIVHEIIGKRAIKRAMHILARQERTEHQLREKLLQSAYPIEAIEDAVAYVKKYHYLDDERYARTFICFHQEKRSRLRLRNDLMKRGIPKNIIEICMEEEFVSDEREQIRSLLEKKNFSPEAADRKECRKVFQFLQRRGFSSSDILAEMRASEE